MRALWVEWCESPFFPAKLISIVGISAVGFGIVQTISMNL